MNKNKVFALVDCNNFYVSCERLFNPALKNRPVVVLSNNDGCVISRSNEAKKLGIKMGEPFFKIREKVKFFEIAVFSSNFSLYGDISSRIMDIMEKFSPKVEVYSIDEAFVELTGINTDLDHYAKFMKDTIEKWTGIPVSVGVATSKTLAKIATGIAKKYGEFNGTFNMVNHPNIKKILESTPIEEVWGIGRGYFKKTQLLGIKNAYQFATLSDNYIKKRFSVNGLRTAMELRGIPVIPSETFVTRKSIVTSRSFKEPLITFDELKASFTYFSDLAGKKLRKEGLETGFIKIFIKTDRFDRKNYFYADNYAVLPTPVNSTKDIIGISAKLLKEIFQKNKLYKKAGILAANLMSANNKQLDLFCNGEKYREKRELSKSMDLINEKYGNYTVKYASMDLSKKFLPNQKRMSRGYTTNLNELAKVK